MVNRTVSPEELFVIEKFTGFNRLRKKYRKPQALAEFVDNVGQMEAKAL